MDHIKDFASKQEKNGEDIISRAEDGVKHAKEKLGDDGYQKLENQAKKFTGNRP
ncbi:ACL074W-Ap [Eremothecium gossypii ATCC 10895]|uniref:ACL074W-Ap n=1 Tax=Eremothecium gossypii (strain ATCC 10895 / CBS 109.51 / FGSC 9923 / NRRL Y-1056) TaxID=284811 RepID=D8FGB0_EREGS|nr:ACL074W-Ap [Eremothecium gossypii ATCC 10895]ADJ41753.1 ACL074W-Ap [Eremothecium gossypii ATCC 10895]AEY95445.1 FACL074W-Ap [Eremothecium gossypii FDAG1]